MKILNDGKMYVQLNNLSYLTRVKKVPLSILERILKDFSTLIINEENKNSFVEFSKKEEIEFFKNQDWIIDFKKMNSLSKEELDFLIKSLKIQLEKEDNNLINYELNSIKDYIEWKKGKKKIIFPMAPDSDKDYLSEDEKYYAIQGINPKIIFIGKKDYSKIEEEEFITPSLVSSSIQEQLIIIVHNNPYFQDFVVERKFSKDQKYYMIEFHQKEYENHKINSNKKENILQLLLKKNKKKPVSK